jgi:thioesterase domain-containing protein
VTKTTSSLITALEKKLHGEIPLTKHMGVHVKEYDASGLSLTVPFAPNVNHICSVFGGSLAAAVTLAGWGFLWIYLEENHIPAHLLIQESTISYLRPVTADFVARCHSPGQKPLHTLLTTLQRKGKGRITLSCEVLQKGLHCVRFTGTYAVLRNLS